MAAYEITSLWLAALLCLGGSSGSKTKRMSQEYDLSDGRTVDFHSVNYPNDADANLRQTWILVAKPDSVVELNCDDIRLFQASPCEDYAVELKDSSGVLHKCGSDFNFQFVSKGSRLDVTLRTGGSPRGFVKCTAKGSVARTVSRKPKPPPSYSFANQEAIADDGDTQRWNHASQEMEDAVGLSPTTCPCGWPIKEKKTVTIGVEKRRTDLYPFMAGLVESGNRYIQCAATIVTAYHAITAAHCIEKGIAYQLVIAGHEITRNESTDDTFMVPVKEAIVHSGYLASVYRNDIAILVLRSAIPYDRHTGPVCLPTGPVTLGRWPVHIIDWGKSKTGRKSNPYLERLRMRVIPSVTCQLAWPKYVAPAGSKHICVVPTRKQSCYGARGGPLVWLDPKTNRFTMVGIASYGSSNCGTRKALISVKLAPYLGWIHRTIRATEERANICTKA